MKDWDEICTAYKGQWIALADDEQTVVAAGKDLKTALALSKSYGTSDPILFRVPDEVVDFVGYENTP